MNEYIGVIRMFSGNFVPDNWMLCDGTVLNIFENNALFNIIGSYFGGDGVKTFALPDLRGRIPIGVAPDGSGWNESTVGLGQTGGEERHVLAYAEMPLHKHTVNVSSANAMQHTPERPGSALAGFGNLNGAVFSPGAGYNNAQIDTDLSPSTISRTGASQGHENRQPFLSLNYIICVQGVNPPRP